MIFIQCRKDYDVEEYLTAPYEIFCLHKLPFDSLGVRERTSAPKEARLSIILSAAKTWHYPRE